ncbi:MAG: Tad domain-containing protein, partial [Chloroflexota bacterium]
MSAKRLWSQTEHSSEAGQSIVLIALVFIVILLFVGLALDAGLAFVRSSQFSRAVDSAVLAGVVDLDPSVTNTDAADTRAGQFLGANGWPTPTLTLFDSKKSITGIGIPQYTLTATWPVSPFFIRLIGIGSYPVTHSATAAFYANAEMIAPTANDDGRMRRASQFVFGPEACTQEGDPVSPLDKIPGQTNDEHSIYDGLYRYRITIPSSYTQTHLRVELFDTDSVNVQGDSATISHTIAVSNTIGMTETLSCSGSLGMGDSCIINTGEDLISNLQNPFWFQRVDETWLDDCNRDASDATGDTVTEFELFYFDAQGDRQPLGIYTEDNSQSGLTDLKWVTPGVTSGVNTDSGSFQGDISGLPQDEEGFRYLHLDVRTTDGASKNVWDIWAGPIPSFYTSQGYAALSENVNERNLQVANSPFAYTRAGISVYALGRMPLENYVGNVEIDLPLSPLEPGTGGGSIYATVFDYEPSVSPP